MAHGVTVIDLARHHHGHDFHVPVGVHAKAAAGTNRVIVNHPQGSKAHPGRVVVVGEGKAMPAIQPVQVAVEAGGGRSEQQLAGVAGVALVGRLSAHPGLPGTMVMLAA